VVVRERSSSLHKCYSTALAGIGKNRCLRYYDKRVQIQRHNRFRISSGVFWLATVVKAGMPLQEKTGKQNQTWTKPKSRFLLGYAWKAIGFIWPAAGPLLLRPLTEPATKTTSKQVTATESSEGTLAKFTKPRRKSLRYYICWRDHMRSIPKMKSRARSS
jgi:hypothetical protein